MANSRDFTGKNRKFTGTKGIVTPKGTTGQRVGSESGELRFNTTIELMEYYDGNQWKAIDAPPTISSISTSDATGDDAVLAADGSTLFTVTITGGNFGIGAVVKFIGNTGTEYAALSVNRVSGSSITCTTRSNMGTTDDPYDVQVTNASGLSALLEDAISFNTPPAFVTASGSLGAAYNTIAVSGSTFNASATDAEGDTITYTIASGSLPSGLSISSSTGYITGTPTANTAGTFNFTVQASTAEGNSIRAFSILIADLPTGGTITTSGGFRYHTFLSSSNFVVPSGFSATAEYLIIAGGGGGSGGDYATGAGGGGAGGLRSSTAPISSNTYPVIIGGGGTGVSGGGTRAGQAGPSSVFGITSTGGGAGGSYPGNNGQPGGSGGGGGYDGPAGSGTAGQGNAGGTGSSARTGGGGGGAGGVGGNASTPAGGAGGVGVNTYSTWASATSTGANSGYYAGGGGGGASDWTDPPPGGRSAGSGGLGGGGAGGDSPSTSSSVAGSVGTINTGGGAGGSAHNGSSEGAISLVGANGGSGIVIIRYTI